LLNRTATDSPYWPGTIVVLEDDRSPRPENLLEGLSRDELRGEA
jgi:hypothetical protein